MTLQERLRQNADDKTKRMMQYDCESAADALDAKDARIAELAGALRVAIKHWEGWCNQNNGSLPDNVMGGEADDYARAREALK